MLLGSAVVIVGIIQAAEDDGDSPSDTPSRFADGEALSLFRRAAPVFSAKLKAALAELRGQGAGPSFAVRRVELVKAWLSEGPPEFDTLASYPLRGAR